MTKKTVVVGMSGGVDSSVAAYLLKEQGFNVIGLFMNNWEDDDTESQCSAQRDYQDVAFTCSKLDIPFYGVSFAKEYKENVFLEFVEQLKMGLTPNPDTMCNKEIKFHSFYNKALEMGADFVATGHYCKNVDGQLSMAKDAHKDQTYFLYAMNKDCLKKVLFPLGDLLKDEVRAIAKAQGIPTHDKKDSTGICFIGEKKFRTFMQNYIESQKGNFCTLDGTVVGEHEGACFYTLGQRRHLGLGGPGKRWFVVKKDMLKNIVYVERDHDHPELFSTSVLVKQINWLSKPLKVFPSSCLAKVRHQQKSSPCVIESFQDDEIRVSFHEQPQRALAPGQAIVFYSEGKCLGGGVITS